MRAFHLPLVGDLTFMSFRCNQEEVLKSHTLRRRSLCKSDALALPKEERDRIPKFHAREMDTNTGSGASAKGVERYSGSG